MWQYTFTWQCNIDSVTERKVQTMELNGFCSGNIIQWAICLFICLKKNADCSIFRQYVIVAVVSSHDCASRLYEQYLVLKSYSYVKHHDKKAIVKYDIIHMSYTRFSVRLTQQNMKRSSRPRREKAIGLRRSTKLLSETDNVNHHWWKKQVIFYIIMISVQKEAITPPTLHHH